MGKPLELHAQRSKGNRAIYRKEGYVNKIGRIFGPNEYIGMRIEELLKKFGVADGNSIRIKVTASDGYNKTFDV